MDNLSELNECKHNNYFFSIGELNFQASLASKLHSSRSYLMVTDVVIFEF